MSENRSKFDIWWNLPETKQKLGAAYSLGASVVIIGAMFKILHLEGAGYMLGIGMSVEAFLFALGIFDQPHKDYEWDKIYDFENGQQLAGNEPTAGKPAVSGGRSVGLNYSESISDDDVKKLTEGIKNLTVTAQQLSELSTVAGSAGQLAKTLDNASSATGKFITTQEALNSATGQLSTSYQGIMSSMDAVEKNTKQYASKVEDINKNLSSINTIYEIQLKNIQVQSEGLNKQTEKINTVSDELSEIASQVQKMKTATVEAAEQTENFKSGTNKLAKQVADLNQIYGNMLNALS